jgi:gliding motility-associated lipoprotein GldB
MKIINFVFILLLFLLFACAEDKVVKPEILSVQVDVDILRFDSVFANAKPEQLVKLKQSYPYLLNREIPDNFWVTKMNDSLQNEIELEVSKSFKDFRQIETDIVTFFKHLKYYFPNEDLPKVITVAEYVDYNSKVVLNDGLLFISLDNYLGKEHRFYQGFKAYISNLQEPSQILPDIAGAYANKLVTFPKSRNFLSQIIYNGKLLYFKETMLPLVDKHQLIGYTQDQLNWATQQEIMIWRYFIQNELLYSTDADLRRRFIDKAPFSKFYLEIDNDTPPRLGQYIGWQIVKAYAEKYPDKDINEILETGYQEIFDDSNYKP